MTQTGTLPNQFVFPDLETLETELSKTTAEDNPGEWARLMNIKGVILTSTEKYAAAEEVFNKAIPAADVVLKCKVFINYSKSALFARKPDLALQLVNRVFEIVKTCRRPNANILTGFAHMLRGQIFYRSKNDKAALTEFKKAEFFFEAEADLSGVGLSCMEIARVHVNNKNLQTAWHYLKKSENCLQRFGTEESLGVSVCKAVALFHSGREEEAEVLLKKAYAACNEFGLARYMLSEMLDAYLDIRNKSIQFQKKLV